MLNSVLAWAVVMLAALGAGLIAVGFWIRLFSRLEERLIGVETVLVASLPVTPDTGVRLAEAPPAEAPLVHLWQGTPRRGLPTARAYAVQAQQTVLVCRQRPSSLEAALGLPIAAFSGTLVAGDS